MSKYYALLKAGKISDFNEMRRKEGPNQVIHLTGANLSGADLTGAYLSGAYLCGAYLTGANLRGADLTGAYLTGAYLKKANLTGADLTGANLSGANLSGADLKEVLGLAENTTLKFCILTGAQNVAPELIDTYLQQIGRSLTSKSS